MKKAELAWEKIIIWILLLAFLVFGIMYLVGADQIISNIIEGIFSGL